MSYIIERNSTANGFASATDDQASGIREYVNYHVKEEGYKLHSVVPIPNSGDHIIVLEPDDRADYTVYYHDHVTGKMILEFQTLDMLEQLRLVKETDEIVIENAEGIFECSYVSSRINVFDNGAIISEVLDIYFNVKKVE